jgi:hypothetical protein
MSNRPTPQLRPRRARAYMMSDHWPSLRRRARAARNARRASRLDRDNDSLSPRINAEDYHGLAEQLRLIVAVDHWIPHVLSLFVVSFL